MKLLPERRPIASFGNGGFRFGDHSHRGHLLILPSGMSAWDGIDYAPVMAEISEIDFFVIGTGAKLARLSPAIAKALHPLQVDAMSTSAAIHTYNLMLGEGRRVAAALIAVP